MDRKIGKDALEQNIDIIKGVVCELIFEVSDDLGIGLQAADDIVRATELYTVLVSECILQNDYDLDGLKLILRKELVRSGKYPTAEEKPIKDFFDFVNTMRHEVVYNCAMYMKLKLNLTQVSLLIEDIGNFVVDKNVVQTVKDISAAFGKCIRYLDPVHVGKNDIDLVNSFNEIWWKFNANIQTILAYCKVQKKSPDDLTDDEISSFMDNKMI